MSGRRALSYTARAGVEGVLHPSMSNAAPFGSDKFGELVQQNGGVLRRRYVSELARNLREYDSAQE